MREIEYKYQIFKYYHQGKLNAFFHFLSVLIQVYFIQKFLEKNKSGSERNIYQHVTCATDTKNVKVVFNACKDIILQENLAKMGIA